jgi:hypothetical protein
MLSAVRYGLPAVIVLVGVVLLAIDPSANGEGAAAIVGAGLSVALLNVLHRIGVKGEDDRADEAAARAYFDAHGRWPDDDGEAATPEPAQHTSDSRP